MGCCIRKLKDDGWKKVDPGGLLGWPRYRLKDAGIWAAVLNTKFVEITVLLNCKAIFKTKPKSGEMRDFLCSLLIPWIKLHMNSKIWSEDNVCS